jgi:hypothetical protein
MPPSSKAEKGKLPMQMDVENVFHMTGGIGVTSYAKNSSLQVFPLSFSHGLFI